MGIRARVGLGVDTRSVAARLHGEREGLQSNPDLNPNPNPNPNPNLNPNPNPNRNPNQVAEAGGAVVWKAAEVRTLRRGQRRFVVCVNGEEVSYQPL